MPQQSLELEHLTLSLEHDSALWPALFDVGIALQPGEIHALLGESGCGKSMTALAIQRLLTDNFYYSPDSACRMGETDIFMLTEQEMRSFRGKRLAMVFQEPMTALNPVLTIRCQLQEALRDKAGLSKKEIEQRLCHALEEVELADARRILDKYPHQLSGGQKQRVVIAIALLNKPDIIIADEPTTALDVTTQAQILKLLSRLVVQHQLALLLITHDLTIVRQMASTVTVMYAGKIVERASCEAFFSRPKHPYTRALMQAIPEFTKRGQYLSVIPGVVPALQDMPEGCAFHPRCPYADEHCQITEPPLKEDDHHAVRCIRYPKGLPEDWCGAAPVLNLPNRPSENTPDKVMLEAVNVSITYTSPGFRRQNIQVVDGVSLSIASGKTIALVGESGCGKTTLSKAMIGLLPIQDGSILFAGKTMTAFSRSDWGGFRQKVQMVYQDPFASLNPRHRVLDIVTESLLNQGVAQKQRLQRAQELMDLVGLPKASIERYPHQFSGGQRQRIAIARALASSPSLIICDEPTSALDVSVQAQILNLLQNLQAEFGISYLFISHNLNVVAYFCDEIYVMQQGKIVEYQATVALIRSPQHAYTKRLLEAVMPTAEAWL